MSPLDLKFVFVVGKGGVGKSAVSAAMALAAAAEGKRVLVAMCNTKERLSGFFGCDPIGTEIVPAAPNVDAVNMEPEAALREYGMMVLKVRALYRLIFENRYVAAFLRGTPGLEAWAMLGKAQFHAQEKRRDGSPRYDLVIVDAPATGHGLDLLRVPRVIVEVAPPGLLRKEAQRAWELFSDATRAGVMLVTLPEDMPTNETIELHAAVTGELGLPICGLTVNAAAAPLFDDGEIRAVQSLGSDEALPEDLASVVAAAGRRVERDAIQQDCIQKLRTELAIEPLVLPRLPTAVLGPEQAGQLADVLREQLA